MRVLSPSPCVGFPSALVIKHALLADTKTWWTLARSRHRNKFAASCKDLGIEGRDLAAELSGLSKELPAIFDGVVAATQATGMVAALEYYQAFVEFNSEGVCRAFGPC